MRPFDFVILFFSFIYTLALTHLLLAAARMVRHRRQIVFSWPHALWMMTAFALLSGNWLSLWDIHAQAVLSLWLIASFFGLVVVQYYICAVLAPDFEDPDDYDLRRFHERERSTYLLGFLALMAYSLAINTAAGVQNWGQENLITLAFIPPIGAAIFVRRTWVQVLAPALTLVLAILFPVLYYPSLR